MIYDQTSSSESLVLSLRDIVSLWLWWWNFDQRWWHNWQLLTRGGIVALQLLDQGLELSLLWLLGLGALVSHYLLV